MSAARTGPRFAWLAAALVVAGAAAFASAARQNDRESRDRHVFASVVDKSDAPVAGLGVADFSVAEDGIDREILKVSPATAPMQLALLLDNSDAVEPLVADLRRAASGLAQQILAKSPTSEILVMTFGERPVTEVPFTSSAIAVLKGTGGLISRSGSGAYMLQAIPDACKALTKHGATRPVIVAFTSQEGPEFSDNRSARVVEAIKAAGVTLWTIAYQAPGLSRFDNTPEGRERMEVLNTVANNTGGENKVVLASSALEGTFQNLATMLTSEYDVMYSRPVALVPPQRLVVTLKRPGLRLWAPHWAGQ